MNTTKVYPELNSSQHPPFQACHRFLVRNLDRSNIRQWAFMEKMQGTFWTPKPRNLTHGFSLVEVY